jgi:hypothetical protein
MQDRTIYLLHQIFISLGRVSKSSHGICLYVYYVPSVCIRESNKLFLLANNQAIVIFPQNL